jgi:hypothetical protein
MPEDVRKKWGLSFGRMATPQHIDETMGFNSGVVTQLVASLSGILRFWNFRILQYRDTASTSKSLFFCQHSWAKPVTEMPDEFFLRQSDRLRIQNPNCWFIVQK